MTVTKNRSTYYWEHRKMMAKPGSENSTKAKQSLHEKLIRNVKINVSYY